MYRSGGGSNASQTYSNPTFTGQAGFAAGNASAPGAYWSTDTTSGFFRGNANKLCWSSNTTNILEFSSQGIALGNSRGLGWVGSADPQNGTFDTAIWRAGANSILFNTAGTAATTTARTEINKAIASITDNVATLAFTVTIPNAAHSASMRVVLKGSAGAGGAIGANEATRSIEYRVDVTRTTGVNAFATISAPGMNPAAAIVAGGNGITVTGTLSAISGAVGATNTFNVNVTIARAAGTATNHTCFAYAELLNDAASGVTIA